VKAKKGKKLWKLQQEGHGLAGFTGTGFLGEYLYQWYRN
jgi:hypothetical protein